MLRQWYETGVTSFPSGLYPAVGYKWLIKRIYLELSAGSTVGTRSVSIYLDTYNGGFSRTLLSMSETGVSTNYFLSLTGDAGADKIIYSDIPVDRNTVISADVTLLSGDTMTWNILVDEVPDE